MSKRNVNREGVLEWTPIQEGRFHLRNMRKGETIPQYIMRLYPSPTYTPVSRRERRQRIGPLIALARAERDRLARIGGRR